MSVEKAKALLKFGAQSLCAAKFAEAQVVFRQALELARAEKAERLQARALARLMTAMAYQGKSDDVRPEVMDMLMPAIKTWKDLPAVLVMQSCALRFFAEPEKVKELAIKWTEDAAKFPGDLDLARAAGQMAVICNGIGELKLAAHLLERALPVMEAQVGAAHPEVAMMVFNLGDLRFTLGGRKDYAAFETPLRRAMAAQEAGLAPGHPERVAPLMTAGVLFARTRRFEEAEHALNTAMKIAVGVEGPGGQTPEMVRAGFGVLDQALADPTAEPYLLKGIEKQGTPHETGVRLWKLCRHYLVRASAEKAEPYYRKLREIGEQLGESPEGTLLKAETGSYGAAYRLLGENRHDDAASLVLGELQVMERVLPAGHPDIQQQRYFAGNIFRMMGRHKQALKLFERYVQAERSADGLMRLMDEQLWLGEKKDAERTAAEIEKLTGRRPVMDPALNEFARQLQSVWHMLQLKEAPDLIGAALRRDPGACLVIGLCWSAGQGVPRDNDQARPWFEIAAEAGNPIAADILGVLDKGADIQGDMESIVNCAKMWLDSRK